MKIINVLRFIINHPLNKKNKITAIWRFVKWQISSAINPYPIIYNFISNSKLIISKNMTGATGNLYCGLHDFTDMSFLLHFLRSNDTFFDIGANVGSYTILASSHVGAYTVSFEPVPETYQKLLQNIAINNISPKVKALNVALADKIGTIKFTNKFDTTNHAATVEEIDTIDVPVSTLDNIVENSYPTLMKIDVEGFETDVIKGAERILSDNKVKALIIELNGSGKRYGYDENKIHETLLNYDFKPYIYDPFTRGLLRINSFGTHNTIYIRDVDFVIERLRTANNIELAGYIY